MTKRQLLGFVKMLNEVKDAINIDKVRFDVTEGTGEDKKVTRYYITQRPKLDTDGIEVWQYVARCWSGK